MLILGNNNDNLSIKLSIVIPTWEAKGRATELLGCLLNSIKAQTYTNYEVIVSDHSEDDGVKNFCVGYDMDINYIRNETGRGNSSINMNVGISAATGDFIKVVHMDDWISNPNTLTLMTNELLANPQYKWGGFSFNHFIEDKGITNMTPSKDSTMGCPSVTFFRNDNNFFDESLIIVNDKDMHDRLGIKYGEPLIINTQCITIRMHKGQVSHWIGKEKEDAEFAYLANKKKTNKKE
jgi:glycosyltransferase involved in cell wall biosynthesis